MQKSPIHLVCFDLGGVLVRIRRSWAEACAGAGLDVRGPTSTDTSAARRHDIAHRYQTGALKCEAFFTELASAIDNLYSSDDLQRIHHAWLIEEYAGVEAVIERIHKAGLRTAALSNTNHAHWERMDDFASVMLLQTRLASHKLGFAKPDEAIYREAERRLGVRGGQILFFDDLEENVAAAKQTGWNAVKIDHAGDPAAQIDKALYDYGVFKRMPARPAARSRAHSRG